MAVITIEYPDQWAFFLGDQETFSQEARLAMAVKLFELKRLSSGQAAQLAEVSLNAFILTCERFGVDFVDWDEEEIQRELF
jgi:predicted HTH domain antitoxin